MPADRRVFISFSSKDLAAAEAIREAIERRGFACWMSSRDILSGENFQEAIVAALRRAGAVVLVFSASANQSSEIKKEVALASTFGIPLIPARLDETLPAGAFAYEFITRQWIDLFPDRDAAVRRLCHHLEALGKGETGDAAGGAGFTAPLSLAEISNNLPHYDTPFIGRETERVRLTELLGKHRLVTLLGTGGLGKTRLSVEVARTVLRRYPDGVWLAELAPLADPELVAESVAGILSLEVPPSRKATDVVVSFLRDKTLLLILDNCEHLIAAAAAFAQALVRGCPKVTLLASSREPLSIGDEHSFRMPTLAAPPADAAAITAAEAMAFPAVALFVARAKAALGEFELSDTDAPAVGAICRRLDGIALAIELAAPRLKMLRPAELLEKLDERFRILTGGNRTALPRQQTLRALIDWSFNLLIPAEQALLRRLAVFPGGWTMDAATEVCAGEPVEDWEIFDLMASLIDKSLVHTERTETETRYSLLESMRAYAREKLKAAGETHWPGRMAAWLADLIKQADWEYETTPTPPWRERYGAEIDNLRAALDLSFAPGGDVTVGLRLMAYSGWLWNEMDLSAEKRRRAELAYSRLSPQTEPAVAARIYATRAAAPGTGLNAVGKDSATLAVELARQSGDALTLGKAMVRLASGLIASQSFDKARSLLDEAVSVTRSIGKIKTLDTTLNLLGILHYMVNQRDSARLFYEDALAIGQSLNDPRGVTSVLINLAELSFMEGLISTAVGQATEGLSMAEEYRLTESRSILSANLAAYLIIAGDYTAGRAMGLSAARQARDLEHDLICACSLQHLNAIAVTGDRLEGAARLQGFIDHVYSNHHAEREPTDQLTYDRVNAALGAHLEDSQVSKLMAEGVRLSLDEAINLAEELLTKH